MNVPRHCCALLLFFVPFLANFAATAADDIRYETGRRLRLFESNWAKTSDSEARRRALEPLKLSVNQFLGGKQLEAARSLDAARFALLSAQPLDDQVRFAESLAVVIERRFLDANSEKIAVSIVEFYPSGATAPPAATIALKIVANDGSDGPGVAVPLERLPATAELPLSGLGEGDYRLRFRVGAGERALAGGEYRFSLVKDLVPRLERLATATADFEQAQESLDKLSAAALVKLLAALAAGQPNETDYPAARLLTEAEATIAAAAAGKPYYGPQRTGQFWLRAGTPRQNLHVRLMVPDAARTEKPFPLVIALHGAGGSENLFFDGYGQGAIADLCQERGWMVVSPRTAGFGLIPVEDLVATLARVYPIDRERVFLVGHSMGAMQASAAAIARPEMFAAVAALGGGGAVKKSPALAELPYYVAAGSQDFALSGARRLADNLRAAGALHVTFEEYPDVEHLLIVQEALPKVFRFFANAAHD